MHTGVFGRRKKKERDTCEILGSCCQNNAHSFSKRAEFGNFHFNIWGLLMLTLLSKNLHLKACSYTREDPYIKVSSGKLIRQSHNLVTWGHSNTKVRVFSIIQHMISLSCNISKYPRKTEAKKSDRIIFLCVCTVLFTRTLRGESQCLQILLLRVALLPSSEFSSSVCAGRSSYVHFLYFPLSAFLTL